MDRPTRSKTSLPPHATLPLAKTPPLPSLPPTEAHPIELGGSHGDIGGVEVEGEGGVECEAYGGVGVAALEVSG